ncbi:hypothetical protein OG792_17965 [Micromonospora sp. NBC_01699]|uniref:hypothetical protein n=1 Tax=Micromonospora sp. NBC_01699 TaxID=2975984 RepID=UPI002E28F210|nr:hypothetical protein [Micromonospora sp. NBC_01699]
MEIRFDFGDDHGRVLVEVVPNADPVAVGKSERELGVPVCTASVEFSASGFRPALFDAPSRWRSGAVQWRAHSFLTIGPWNVDRQESSR